MRRKHYSIYNNNTSPRFVYVYTYCASASAAVLYIVLSSKYISKSTRRRVDNFLANFLLSHVRPLPDDVVNEGKKLFNETRDNEK